MSEPNPPILPNHVAPAKESANSDFSVDDFRASVTAVSQVSGLLGGFCITILVLVLSRDFLTNQQEAKNWIITLLFIGSFLYITSAYVLVYMMNTLIPYLRDFKHRVRTFFVVSVLLNLANLLLFGALSFLIYQNSPNVVFLIAAIFVGIVVLSAALYSFGYFFVLNIIRLLRK